MSGNFWRNVDLKKLEIPNDILMKKTCVTVAEKTNCVENAKVFAREALPPAGTPQSRVDILLLHGRRFSSKTWLDLETIHILAASGYRTLAIDIPGYGNSAEHEIKDRGVFLSSLIKAFELHNPVIVSPSLSGFFTFPFLIKEWESLAGYVPVAPVGFEVLEKLPIAKDSTFKDQVYAPLQEFLHDPIPDLSFIKTPTMVVFGEKDRSRTSALLSLLPNSQCQEIPNGSHPAYLDDPDLWHQIMYNFLYNLSNS